VDRRPVAGNFTFSVQCCGATAQPVADETVTLRGDEGDVVDARLWAATVSS
jgi:hypothetical protein